jgi:hypothetical protein
LDKIETIMSRRGSHRRLLTDSLRVHTIVKASDESAAVSMASSLTPDNINSELEKAGMPKATMLESPKAATVEPRNVEPVQDNQQKTSNNSTTIAAVVSTVVVATVLLAGALFWRHRVLTKSLGSKSYQLSPEAATAVAAANDSEQSGSTQYSPSCMLEICEHNRIRRTCQQCGAGAFGFAGAFGLQDPLSEPLPQNLPSIPHKPEEELHDSVLYVPTDQIDVDAVLMDICPSPSRVTRNSPIYISGADIDRGTTTTNFEARTPISGPIKKTKVQLLVQAFETRKRNSAGVLQETSADLEKQGPNQVAPIQVSVDHGLVISRQDLHSLSAGHVVRERILQWKNAEDTVKSPAAPPSTSPEGLFTLADKDNFERERENDKSFESGE